MMEREHEVFGTENGQGCSHEYASQHKNFVPAGGVTPLGKYGD
jgi:hypothetical protein